MSIIGAVWIQGKYYYIVYYTTLIIAHCWIYSLLNLCQHHSSCLAVVTLSQAYRPSEIYWSMGLNCLTFLQNIKQVIVLQVNIMMKLYKIFVKGTVDLAINFVAFCVHSTSCLHDR